jgi:protein-S-isoprenylcysteine O-methyltransferase Ste14
MFWFFLGSASFLILTLYDLNKIYRLSSLFDTFFALGSLTLLSSCVGLYLNQNTWGNFKAQPIFWLISIIGFIEMIYALFFALDFKRTYVESGKANHVVDYGIYALCRHPGVWGFALWTIGAALAMGSMIALYGAILWTLLDVLHVILQDTMIFEKTIQGYKAYKQKVPFLFFGSTEIKRCMQTLRSI